MFGDFDFGTVWALSQENDSVWTSETLVTTAGRISSFGLDEAGELYIVDFTGTIRRFAEPINTAAEEPPDIPRPFALKQNFPNPFSTDTQIAIDVAEPGVLTLDIFDLTGRNVRTFENRYDTPGQYVIRWNGVDNAGMTVASGIYVYTLEAGDYRTSQSMIFLK